MDTLQSYIVEDIENLPLHLKHRSPSFSIDNVAVIFKRPLEEICEADGRVKFSGIVEFQASINAGVLTDYCDPGEIHSAALRTTHRFRAVYDPEIQRGVKETKSAGVKEFLRESQIDSMMEDIHNERFECPQLMWNLRAGEVVWVYLVKAKRLSVYQGVATRPDTNHRHHAIIRFHKKYLAWVEQTSSTNMPGYNPTRQYGLVVYTDDFEGEAHRFYIYNFKGWRVSASTAHYIESKTHTPAIHAKVARETMERSGILGLKNVEILSAQLSRNSAKMITFGTLTEALKTAFPGVSESDLSDTLDYIVQFLEVLHNVRPAEITLLSVAQRQAAREKSVADQAVLWHGYFRLASWLQKNASETWRQDLLALGQPVTYQRGGKTFTGDLFSRDNPVWVDTAVMAPGKTGLRVLNNRQAREAAFDILKAVVSGKGLNSIATNQHPPGAVAA